MTVLVQMIVKVPDYEKFKAAYEWMMSRAKPAGSYSYRLMRQVGDENNLTLLQEWDSHDRWMEVADEIGEEFNRRAGTEGLDWQTYIWHGSDVPDW